MNKIDNFLTKIIHNTNCYCILTFFDCGMCFNNQFIEYLLTSIVQKNDILKMKIKNNSWVSVEKQFYLKDYYTSLIVEEKDFDKYTKHVLNKPFKNECRWHCTVLNVPEKNICRLYFKIDHSYCDGYNLIEMLSTTVIPYYKKVNFKRTSVNLFKNIYYSVVGTIILFLINIKIILKLFFKTFLQNSNSIEDWSIKKMDNINCGSLDFIKAKSITKKYGVTMNSFLYSLMVITWHNYNDECQNNPAFTVSPISIKKTNTSSYNTNNIFFIFSEIKNEKDPVILLKTVDYLFNLYKMSFYIPIINYIMTIFFPFIPDYMSAAMTQDFFHNIELTYSNMVGPFIHDKDNVLKIKKSQFTTATQQKETCFNIVSFLDNIYVNISFRKGVISNKKKFIKSFKRACTELFSLN